MRYSFVTLFPALIEGYFSDSILHKAIQKGHLHIDFVNPRDYTTDKFGRVDAPITGGGAGMLMSPQPLYDALEALLCKSDLKRTRILFVQPDAKPFKSYDAKRLATQFDHLILVSGRYEGIDERVVEHFADEVFSVGDYILTGGELASLIVADATARFVAGVLGNEASLEEESFEDGLLEAPSFTKPHEFRGKVGISEYLKGNHSKISDLKKQMALCKTSYYRPDLYGLHQKG